MTDPISSAPGSVADGEIVFYDSIQPPLSAGSYTLRAEQRVTSLKEAKQPFYQVRQPLKVTAPRFQIDPSQIHQVFPPADHEGSYSEVLPSIVLKDPALPWMRALVPGQTNVKGSPPWMALLTVYGAEMPAATGQPTNPDAKLERPTTVTVGQLLAPDDVSVLPPALPDADPKDTSLVQVVDLDLAFFRGIAPKAAELPFLAHAREVDTGGKALLGMDSGVFSLVVGNRMVGNGGSNTAMLVSLEGHADHLPGGKDIPATYRKIRLVLLGSWSFQAAAAPGGFLQLMSRLCDPGYGGVALLRLPAAETEIPDALQPVTIGYVPLDNALRDGEATTSWYRGPLVPAPTAVDNTYGPYHYSDHAIHYDPQTGLFNHAYAAAWQIGRLLALSDADFTRTLFEWRRDFFAQTRAAATTAGVASAVADAMPEGQGLKQRFALMLGASAPALHAVLPMVAPRHCKPELAELPGVLADRDLDEVLADADDPLLALKRKLTRSAQP